MSGIDGLPIQELLKAIFSCLPLQEDPEPYGAIYHAFIKLVRDQNAQMFAPHLDQAIQTAVSITQPYKAHHISDVYTSYIIDIHHIHYIHHIDHVQHINIHHIHHIS